MLALANECHWRWHIRYLSISSTHCKIVDILDLSVRIRMSTNNLVWFSAVSPNGPFIMFIRAWLLDYWYLIYLNLHRQAIRLEDDNIVTLTWCNGSSLMISFIKTQSGNIYINNKFYPNTKWLMYNYYDDCTRFDYTDKIFSVNLLSISVVYRTSIQYFYVNIGR